LVRWVIGAGHLKGYNPAYLDVVFARVLYGSSSPRIPGIFTFVAMSLSTAVDYSISVVTVYVLGSAWHLESITTYLSLSGPYFHPLISITGYDSTMYLSAVLLPEFTWEHLVIVRLSAECTIAGDPFHVSLADVYGPLLRSNPPSTPASSAKVSSMGPPTGDIFRAPTGNILLNNSETRGDAKVSAGLFPA
jgi:hypothetical protein